MTGIIAKLACFHLWLFQHRLRREDNPEVWLWQHKVVDPDHLLVARRGMEIQ